MKISALKRVDGSIQSIARLLLHAVPRTELLLSTQVLEAIIYDVKHCISDSAQIFEVTIDDDIVFLVYNEKEDEEANE